MENEISEQGTVLNVPYLEKEDAKRLGAKWDPYAKKWFVPAGVSTAAFGRWLPQMADESTAERAGTKA